METYAARLLFQFRVDGVRSSMKTCEKRIVRFQARNAKDALAVARKKGKASSFRYKNADGRTVFFECVGIQEILHLGDESDPDTVWWEIVAMKNPSERKDALFPTHKQLLDMANT